MKQHRSFAVVLSIIASFLFGGAASPVIAQVPIVDATLGNPKLVQEIDCGAENGDLLFMDYPAGISKVETILDKPCRVLTNKEGNVKYFAYRVGEGKGLKPGATYRLAVEYPEDQSRTIYVLNWGCETASGFATGQSLGDVLKGKYVPSNSESLKYPLSGKMQTWSQVFNLHDRFPEIKRPRGLGPRPLTPADGFWVIFAQTPPFLDPLGAGTAISKISLYEIQDPTALALKINFPPEGLPRRHIFSREEMADGVLGYPHKPQDRDETQRGVKEIADWYDYKLQTMRFLGMNTLSKDLLEFGHNQGWDSADGGGDRWVYQSSTPFLWEQILDRAKKYGVTVLPYYEYRGTVGSDKSLALGPQHRARRLDGGETYTNITWTEGNNADITDPDTIADAKKLLDISLVKYKDKVPMIGAWFRQRPTAMPVSFNDKNLRMFSAEANGGKRIARAQLSSDKALLDKYYAWWFDKRVAFFDALRDHLREQIGPQAVMLYTNDASEPGRPLPRSITGEGKPNGWEWMQVVVTDDFATWSSALSGNTVFQYIKPYDIKDVVGKDMHLRALATWSENWDDKYDNVHSTPPNDPERYKDNDGVMLTYTYNKLYTVNSKNAFDAYNTKGGLAMVRHYSLNENEMSDGNDEVTGYFMCDVERSGPYSMMAEARAMANGNPTYIGALDGNSCNRGFPDYVRNFNAAFLSLPALPSEVAANASPDADVVVRAIKTPKHGTYFAVVNTSFVPKEIVVTLPAAGNTTDAATAQPVAADGGKVTLSLYPGQLRALHVK